MLVGRHKVHFSSHGTEDFHDACIMILLEDILVACALHSIFDTYIDAEDVPVDISVTRGITARDCKIRLATHDSLKSYLRRYLVLKELKSAVLCFLAEDSSSVHLW